MRGGATKISNFQFPISNWRRRTVAIAFGVFKFAVNSLDAALEGGFDLGEVAGQDDQLRPRSSRRKEALFSWHAVLVSLSSSGGEGLGEEAAFRPSPGILRHPLQLSQSLLTSAAAIHKRPS